MSRRVAVIFPGQGSQSVGMADDIVKASSAARELFARAAAVLEYDLLALIQNGPEVALQDTRVSQPAIFVTNLALLAAMGDALRPIVAAGHSFAEYCALTIAGVFPFETALRLVRDRALAMGRAAEKVPGAMSAVLGLDAVALRGLIKEVQAEDPETQVSIANFNAPTQIVISGERRGVEAVGARAAAAGAKRVVPLNVSGAWHSPLMRPARREFQEVLSTVPISTPTFAVISNVDAMRYTEVEQIRVNLLRSITDEVLWHDAVLELLRFEPDLVVEFGGGRVLVSLLKRLPDAPEIRHVGDGESVRDLCTLLA